MSLLFRYLTKNNAMILLPTLAVGIGLYVLTALFERLDNFIEAGLSVGMVLTYFVVKMPLVISQILPVIFLLSTVIQLCIMARSRELTALQAGGISLGVVANSMILCGIFWGGVQLGFSEYLGVAGERESARIWQEEVRKKNLAATVLKDVWFTDGDWIVSLGTLDPQAHGTGFSGYELSDDGLSIKRIVQASTFTAEPNHWALQNVRVYTPDTFTQEQEPDFVLPLRQDPETFRLVSTGTKPQQLPLWQLGDAISQLKSSGSNVYGVARQAGLCGIDSGHGLRGDGHCLVEGQHLYRRDRRAAVHVPVLRGVYPRYDAWAARHPAPVPRRVDRQPHRAVLCVLAAYPLAAAKGIIHRNLLKI